MPRIFGLGGHAAGAHSDRRFRRHSWGLHRGGGLLGINHGIFISKIIEYMDFSDISMGLVKAAFFGLILSLVGCFKGFYTSGGAEGVGRATTPGRGFGQRADFGLGLRAHRDYVLGQNGRKTATIIELVDIYKSFGSQQVLKGINLGISQGQTTVIIGRSGGGKSVMLKHMIGLIKPDQAGCWWAAATSCA